MLQRIFFVAWHDVGYASLRNTSPHEAHGMQMTVSGVSHYRGATIEEILPLAKALKASYLKHGVS
jgi:hypothetical protein